MKARAKIGIVGAMMVATVAIPATAFADASSGVGGCVKAGNYNYLLAGQTTGGGGGTGGDNSRSELAATGPGAVAQLIASARDGATCPNYLPSGTNPYPAPGSAQ
jgi:hypothetical protein